MQDLAKSKRLNYNETQLKVYANYRRFVGVLGGGFWITYFFGGKSLTLHIMPDDLYESFLSGHKCYYGAVEITSRINFYKTVFPKLSNQTIVYARDIKNYATMVLEIF